MNYAMGNHAAKILTNCILPHCLISSELCYFMHFPLVSDTIFLSVLPLLDVAVHKKSENNLKPDAQNKANLAVDGGAAQKEYVGAGMEHGNTELVTDANAEQHQGHYVMRMLVIPLGIFTIGFHCFMLYSCLMIPWRMLFCTIGQIWMMSFIYHCSQDYLVGKDMKKEN
eukprot:UN00903